MPRCKPDNDCNTFTVENCGVSDDCNQDLDGDFSNDPAICRDDLLCACIVNAAGNCSGNWQCTSCCNTSQTGPTGDGCTATQTCALDLLLSANVHGCDELPSTPGIEFGGVACHADSECRSARCARFYKGSGPKNYCEDYCGSDAYCPATGTVCRIAEFGTPVPTNIDGLCWPDNHPGIGSVAVGTNCTVGGECDHGYCADEDNDGGPLYCSEACCSDTDCPGGFTCSLRGNQIGTNFVYPPPGATACTINANCPTGMECFTAGGVCAWRLSETTSMCLRDAAGQDIRRAGAACTQNSDCQSNSCEATLNVCVEVCCSDTTCPAGLTCELETVQTTANLATSSRVCVNLSTDQVLTRR